MNLSSLNAQQRQAASHVNGPLLISAGAGSGKTFTLTQRIAYALSPESGPAARGIDHVLAITFTEKAAEEIKARVRRTLRNEGYIDQALKVDDSWIGTIHGACSKILRTYALEAEVDPAFRILGDLDVTALKQEAIARALKEASDNADYAYDNLIAEYTLSSSFYNALTVEGLLDEVLDYVTQSQDGIEAFSFPDKDFNLFGRVKHLADMYADTAFFAETCEQMDSVNTLTEKCNTAVTLLNSFLVYSADPLCSEESACARFYDIYEQLPMPSKLRSSKLALLNERVIELQQAYKELALALLIRKGNQCGEELLMLAKRVICLYEAKKAELGLLDQDDLLNRTYELLKTNPSIAQQYRDLFDIIMVDEFQDTSSVQINIISLLCKDGLQNLCTVGDEQQSIYRFRGADVGVYRQHKKDMKSPKIGAKYLELNTNYRSSAEVLSFVDDLFGKGPFASEGYMPLEPKPNRDESKVSHNRINLILTEYSGRSKMQVIMREAEKIALRFKELSATFKQSDMVLLLGKMTYAALYAEAIRREGLECIIAGGSIFAAQPEVQTIDALVQVLGNQADTVSLHTVLTGQMFGLSTQDLITLGSVVDDEGRYVKRRNLDKGMHPFKEESLPYSEALDFAIGVLADAQTTALQNGLAAGVWEAVLKSGWLATLEAGGPQGIAMAGNVYKAVRVIETCERETEGLRSAAQRFADYLASGPKEAPGALNVTSANAIRIMTVHASKGLEFDVVAVAQFDNTPSTETLLHVVSGGKHLLSLTGSGSFASHDKLKNRAKDVQKAIYEDYDDLMSISESDDIVSIRLAMAQQTYRGEMEEVYRKLYVALTRAKEILILALECSINASDEVHAGKLTYPILCRYLCGSVFADGTSEGKLRVDGSIETFDYGGNQYGHIYYSFEANDDSAVDAAEIPTCAQPQKRTVPVYRMLFMPPVTETNKSSDFISYTSLSDSDKHGVSSAQFSRDAQVDVQGEDSFTQPYGCAQIGENGEDPLALGLAFHRISQYVVESGVFPSQDTLARICNQYYLSSGQQDRLVDSLNAWFTNGLFKAAMSMPFKYAEVPFTLTLGTRYLVGEIDLLCTQTPLGTGGTAILFDYKTGGSAYEDDQELFEKHLLQAQCYAYALLKQGYSRVEAHFVRVEQYTGARHALSNLETVDYTFNAEQLQAIEQALLAKCDEVLESE